MGIGKKGNIILNMILIIIVLFAFAFVTLFAFKIFDDLSPDILADVTLQESKDMINEVDNRYPSAMDGLIIFLFFLLWAAVIIAAFFMDEHPIFFVFTLILMIFVIIAGVIIGNFYEEIFNDNSMVGLAANFPMTNWMLTNFLLVIIVVGASVGLVLYAKSR